MILSAPSQVKLSRKEDRLDVSTHKEDSVKCPSLEAAIERFYLTVGSSPAQQEPNNTIGAIVSMTTPNLQDVNPYSSWDPSIDPTKESSIDSSLGDITVCQLPSSSMLRVPVTLQGIALKAVIDTAAMVTIVSDKRYREMKPNPPCLKAVTLQTAGRDL